MDSEETVLANGVKEEYQIAHEKRCLIVPVGSTGYMAAEIWQEIRSNLSEYYTNVDDTLINAYEKLNSKAEDSELIKNILSFINLFKDGKYSSK